MEAPVVGPGWTPATVTDKISSIVLRRRSPPAWAAALAAALALLATLAVAVVELLARGVGVWGVDEPVAWGFAIVNFVWWIGIGHAGTLISAILLLLRQPWRTSINRFAEAMTLFAVSCAGLFPLLHLGQPWKFYWLLPYPDTMGLWPQWRSPLVWDVFAVGTYLTVSLLFWFLGLVPDLAALRDRARSTPGKLIYGALALGWRGSARHWARYETAYLLLAGLATPLVVSVHSVVSLDFSVALLPGWHTTIFPPYFVAGAIYSGFAMVLTLAIPLRAAYGLHDFVTERHLDNMGRLLLATGLIVAYGYLMEAFMAWYGTDPFEKFSQFNRIAGPYRRLYIVVLVCNVLLPQLLWSRRVRSSALALFTLSLTTNLGMWLERYVIVVVSLHRDFLTSSWGMYAGTRWDWAALLGSFGLFFTLFLLFLRFLPMISITELSGLVAGEG